MTTNLVVNQAKLLGACLSTDDNAVIQFVRDRVGLQSDRVKRA